MTNSSSRKQALRDRPRRYRERMRAKGLRPVQIWVPDTRTESFRSETHSQALAVAQSVHASEDQEFIEAVSLLPKQS